VFICGSLIFEFTKMPEENFFEFREKLNRRSEPPAGKPDDALTVSQLTAKIERAIKAGFPGSVYVKGEVSNLSLHRSSGHLYFTLKDSDACIDCVMFRSEAAKLKFQPSDGLEILVGGRVAVYPQRGRYQLYATSLQPLGKGALEAAFQQLFQKLEKEGLFATERKKPLPSYPMRIAIVTSRSTAALQDMLKVLRRFPWVHLLLHHVPVQGDGAAKLIADALKDLNKQSGVIGGIDLILLGRGGGSLEDLWAFNEEIVARAIVASRIPIVTGIGHEVDTSIADLVADYHAHTPTEAAQVVTSHWKMVNDSLATAGSRLRRGVRNLVQDSSQRFAAIRRHEFFRRPTDRINQLRQFLDDRQRSLQLAMGERLRMATARMSRLQAKLADRHPKHLVDLNRQTLGDLSNRLTLAVRNDLHRRSQQMDLLRRNLDAISPRAVLKRGYTITTKKKNGAIVRAAAELREGERIVTQFADGTAESIVEDQKQLPLFE
jgi:exodeoxyribonuclease VII large subunit